MIPDLLSHDLIELLRPAVPLIDVSDAAAGTTAPAAASDLAARLVPGQQVTAHVLSGLPGGRFQVQLMNQTLDMNLPPSTLPGQTVELTYLGDQPRLTFMQTAHAAQLAAAPEVTLSQAARLLTRLGQTETAPPAGASRPQLPTLLSGPPTDPAQAAVGLAAGLEKSGLFYEAHQAQWVMGLRALETLRQEPQAALAAAPPGPAGAVVMSARPAVPEAAAGAAALAQSAATAPAQSAAAPLSLPGGTLPDGPAMAALRAQMQMLDSGALAWTGQVWPGQHMDWEIAPDDGDGAAAPSGRRWRTRLTLSLPQLGAVTAWLTLAPDGALEVRCQTDTPRAAAELRAAAAPLADQLASAGLMLTALAVQDG